MKTLRIGMIGYKFMGKAHSNAYRALPMFFPHAVKPEMAVICGQNKDAVELAASQFGWAETKKRLEGANRPLVTSPPIPLKLTAAWAA